MSGSRYNVFFLLILSFLFSVNTFSQANQDCVDALPVCGTTFVPYNGGIGAPDFTPPINTPGCLLNEVNSTWLIFQTTPTCPVGVELIFLISPELGDGEDFDFAVFYPNAPCGMLGQPYFCNASETSGPKGTTGLQAGQGFPLSQTKPGGDAFQPPILAGPNQTYYLLVNNYSGNKGGFTISFSGNAELDCNPLPPCELKIIQPEDITLCQGGIDPIFVTTTYTGNIWSDMDFFWTANPPSALAYLSEINWLNPTLTIPDNFSGTITYTFHGKSKYDHQCDEKEDWKVTVLPIPAVTLQPIPGQICTTADPINLVYTPPGGDFDGGPVYNGVLDPSEWDPGITTLTYTYEAPNGCVKQAEIDVNIAEGPVAEIDYVDEFCVTDPVTTLNAYDLNGKWGGVANAKGEIDPKKLGPGSHKVTYTVTNAQCVNKDEILIEVKPLPVVNITDPGDLCSSQAEVTLAVSPKGGKWLGLPDTLGKVYPVNLGAGSYNAYYTYTDIFGCKNNDTLKIKVNDPPFAIVSPTIQVCNSNDNNNITTLNFSSLISGGDKNGIWTDVSGSGATGSFPSLDFAGIAPGKYTFTYSTNSAKLPCIESSYSVEVEVVNCKCPSVILSPSATLCADNGQLDLETLKQNLNTGSWSISSSPSGGSPASIQGTSIFTTNNSNAGNYTITFTLTNNPPAGCPEQNTTTITVEPKPVASITASTKVCNKPIPGKNPVTLDFGTLITAGDNSGTWVETTSSGASGSFPNLDFTGVTPGVYSFNYTTNSAKAPCTESSYTAKVIVEDCECPSVALYPGTDYCNDAQTVDLDGFKITSEAGNWTIKSKPTGTNPASITGGTLSINGKDGGTYVLTFTLSTPPPPGCPTSSDLTININPSPSAVVTSSVAICNSPASGDPTTVDFDKLITSGNKTGNWSDTDGSGASGSFPNLDFNGVTPGTYTFTYATNTASFPCTDKTYTVEVTVKNCDCPSLALTAKTNLCNSGTSSIDLNTLKQTTESGTWSIKQSAPGPNPASLSGSSFNANGANAGTYIISFTLSTLPPQGCPTSADLTIEVLQKPVATVTSTHKVCNSTGSGQYLTTVNLYSLITAGDKSGTWVDNNNSGAAGPDTNLDFAGITPGTYNFTYTTNSASSPCTESSYNLVITVEDCECPSVATKNPGNLCSSNATIDLNSLKLTTEAGNWTITSNPPGSNPATINGSTFNGTDADAGSYTITFTLATPPQGTCTNSSTQTFNISEALGAGNPTSPAEFCQNAGSQVSLGSLLTNADAGGSWKEISATPSQNNAGNIPNGIFNAQGQNPGTYTIQYTVTPQSPCPVDDSQVQIIINAQPVADAGADQTITCAQQIVPLGGNTTTTGAGIVYTWTGGIVDNAVSSITSTNSPGTYTLSVVNNNTNCKSSDNVIVSGSDDLPKPLNLVLDSIDCFGDSDGKIQFDKITGGTAPYEVFINGISYDKAQYFNKLPPGKYKLTIVDATGCEFNENLELTEPDEIYLNLGSDITVELGDSIMMDAFINIPKNQIDTLLWTPIVKGLCNGCLNPVIYPYFTTPIKLEVIDINGCHAVDEMFVYVDVKRDMYFPNVFTPNDDALNDRFYPFAGGDFIVQIDEFKIYDRWGDMVFEQYNFLPNDFEKGWDGTKNGKRLNTAVYVYYAIVEFKDGKKKVFKGDVLLRKKE